MDANEKGASAKDAVDARETDREEQSLPVASKEQSEAEQVLEAAQSETAATVLSPGMNGLLGEKQQTRKGWGSRYISIRWKVGGSFAILLAMTLVMGIVAVTRLFTLQNQIDLLANQNLQVVEQSNALNEELLGMQASMRGYLITGNTQTLNRNYDVLKGEYAYTFSSLDKLVKGNKADISTLASAKQGFDDYVKYADGLIQERTIGQGTQAIQSESAGKGDQPMSVAKSGLAEIIQKYQNEANQAAKQLQRVVLETISVMAVLGVIAIVVGFVFGIPATLGTPRNIKKVTRILQEIAQSGGDLTRRIKGVKSHDEVEDLANATNALLTSTAELVSSISAQSETLAASAQQLTASTDETARAVNDIATTAGDFAGVSDQAVSALGTLNQSLVSIQSHGEETASRADDVREAVYRVEQSTAHGTDLVNEAQSSMDSMQTMAERTNASVRDLDVSSQEIHEILATIRSIADETNLLALNASIEAARAGDAGRGFAVVAQEVRHLAEQSQQATAKISEIVGRNRDLMKQVSVSMEEGVRAVVEGRTAFVRTQEAFHDIRTAVHDVVPHTEDIVNRITTQKSLISEGHEGVKRLNELMAQVAAGSENNAASSEETLATVQEIAASAHDLAQIAQKLQDVVGRFQL